MINPYAIGFVCVAALAAAGVDYFDQSRKAGMAVGQMGLMSYVDTIPQRFSAAKQEKRQAEAERERKAAWALGGVQFLPEAPEGWSRRALLEGDDSAIMPPESGSGAEDGVGQSLLEQMEAREKVKKTKKRAERSFVYERGTETVFVEVETRARPDSNSLVGLVGATLDGQDFGAFEDILGYDTIGGVAYTETLGDDGAREYHYRVIEGTIGFGHELGLTVHANASRASTNEILAAIDYDGLNRLLPVPMP